MGLIDFVVRAFDGSQVAIALDDIGGKKRQAVSPPRAGTGTPTNQASSASSAQLLAANADRLGLLIFNDSTANLFLKYGTTASATSFTVKIAAGGYWEMPAPIWTGRIDVIWDVANGNVRYSELSS